MRRSLFVAASLLAACSSSSSSEPSGEGGGGAGGGAPADPVATLRDAVEQVRYQTDLVAIAAERTPGSAKWAEVQDLCASRLESLGYTVERHAYETGVNVVGVKAGVDRPTERVYVSAHYDHIPGCPGADDNATGVAGALEAARVLAQGSFRRSLVVVCWDEEEDGLVGSRAYVKRAKDAGEDVVASFVLEMIGYKSDEPGSQEIPPGFDALFPEQLAALAANENRGDFLAIVPDAKSARAAAAIEKHAEAVELKVVTLDFEESLTPLMSASDLGRSDHGSFWLHEYPAMMLTDSANFRNHAYHCLDGDDTVDRLDPVFATKTVQAVVGAAAEELLPL